MTRTGIAKFLIQRTLLHSIPRNKVNEFQS